MSDSILRNRIGAVVKDLHDQGGRNNLVAQAAAAFEKDMRPVCNAIVGALHGGDVAALKGLRALLPHLLEEVNKSPVLGDVLSLQLGRSMLDGIKAKPEDLL